MYTKIPEFLSIRKENDWYINLINTILRLVMFLAARGQVT